MDIGYTWVGFILRMVCVYTKTRVASVGCIYAAHPHIKPNIFQAQFLSSILWENISKYSKKSSRFFLYLYRFYLALSLDFLYFYSWGSFQFDSALRLNACTNISVRADSLATWWAQALMGAKVPAGKYMWVRHTHGDSSPQCLTPTEEVSVRYI